MNNLVSIFVEACWDASIIPYGNQNSFYALTAFDPSAAFYAIALAVAGSVAGYVMNWVIGGMVVKTSLAKQNAKTQALYKKITPYAKRYGWIALLFVWVPFGNYITLLVGFFNVQLKHLLIAASPTITIYYFYQAGML
jgi:membrane protein YqaA with SNARE-associated domain